MFDPPHCAASLSQAQGVHHSSLLRALRDSELFMQAQVNSVAALQRGLKILQVVPVTVLNRLNSPLQW